MKRFKTNVINRLTWMVIILLALTSRAGGQNIILEQDVNQDTVVSKVGKNRSKYTGSFISAGAIIGNTEGDTTRMLRTGMSAAFSFGNYYKLKVNNTYSVLFSGRYRSSRYDFKTAGREKYNRIIVNEFMFEFANRFNYGKRGDYIGRYLELGISADYAFNSKSKVKASPSDSSALYKYQKVQLTNLSYVEKLNYSAHARLGFNKLVFFADYRLSDMINEKAIFGLPPLNVGLRFDLGA